MYNVYKKLEHPSWSPFKKDEVTACNNAYNQENEEDEDIFGTFGKGNSGIGSPGVYYDLVDKS